MWHYFSYKTTGELSGTWNSVNSYVRVPRWSSMNKLACNQTCFDGDESKLHWGYIVDQFQMVGHTKDIVNGAYNLLEAKGVFERTASAYRPVSVPHVSRYLRMVWTYNTIVLWRIVACMEAHAKDKNKGNCACPVYMKYVFHWLFCHVSCRGYG